MPSDRSHAGARGGSYVVAHEFLIDPPIVRRSRTVLGPVFYLTAFLGTSHLTDLHLGQIPTSFERGTHVCPQR